MLAKEFYNDNLYKHILPKDETRLECLEVFFYSYINMNPTGVIVYPNEYNQAIGYIFYPMNNINKVKSAWDFIYYSTKLTKMMKYISAKEFIYFIKSINSNSSKWIEEFVDGEFIHLDLIVVDENYRRQGLAKAIIEEVLKEADKLNMVTTLETQNPINMEIYSKFGFKVVKEQKYESLIQYCMIREPKNTQE